MTYRAIPSPTRRFSRAVRIIASIDLAAAVVLAVPFTASLVLDYMFRVDRLLGFDTLPVDPRPSLVFLLNLAGVIAAVWATVVMVWTMDYVSAKVRQRLT